jgi:hydroxyacid-oxoacid transhydrogenase
MRAEQAPGLLATSLRTAVHHGGDEQARADMAMAATFAGMGFGNAGVHIPHANGYPIAGRVRDFHAKDYPDGEPLVPHGMSVALTAPAAFRFTFDAAAQLLAPGADRPARDADFLPSVLISLMRNIDVPNGVSAAGFASADNPVPGGGRATAGTPAGHLPQASHRGGSGRHLRGVHAAVLAAAGRRRPI